MELTFKQRVEAFWSWFSEHSDRFFQTIEDGKCPDLVDEFQKTTKELLPGFPWVFGPGEDNEGHSFTISGEGDLNRQFLSSYWLEQAPTLQGWTFYSSRQADEIDDSQVIEVDEMRFGPADFLIEPKVDVEEEMIGVSFWHPNFPQCDENLQYTMLNLWLDASLGEIGAQSWINAAEVRDVTGSSKAMPVTDFKAFVEGVQKYHGWEKLPPDETYTLYQLPEPSDEFPRADTISGTTCNMDLIGDYLDSGDQMEDELAGTGAKFVYIGINRDQFPEGNEVEFRGEVEDALNERLKANQAGRVFGGAFGMQSGYVDLVIFDGENSINIVQEVLADKGLDDQYFIRPFANPAS